ncbi:MAG: DMT family transporter [Actinobacteria bacterium]|nr:DMT family transporter [Actinomycetota bacterium]MDA2961016.1 DMT family transporter [Actinomycetota bacterium]MDA2994540.1 DMT family transporter [Actinomycetota bacterium]
MAIVLAVLSALLYGWSDYMGGRATRHMSVLRVTLYIEFLMTVSYVVLVVIDPAPFVLRDAIWGAIAGIGGVGGVAAFYLALSMGSISVASPVAGVLSAVVPVSVGIAMGERPSTVAMVGIAFALSSVVLVSGAMSSRRAEVTMPRSQLLLVVASGGLFGLWYIALDVAGAESGWWPLLTSRTLTLPALIATAVVLRHRLRADRVTPIARRWTFGAWITILVANLAYLVAVRSGLLSIVAVIASMYPASTIGLAIFIDRERLSKTQWLGVGVAGFALVLVGIGA